MSEVAKLETGNRVVAQISAAILPELFVINLCASMTPMPTVPKSLSGFEKYKLYQVSRQEDGRRRFRLRLGFFTNEADAEWVLNSVRSLYPTAFTGCLAHEDLRYAGDALPSAPQMTIVTAPAPSTAAAPAPMPVPAPASKPSPSASAPTQVSKTASSKATVSNDTVRVAALQIPAAPVTVRPPPAQPKQDITLAATPALPVAQPAAQTPPSYAPAFHVARGIEIPETHLELTDEYEILSAPVIPSEPVVKAPAAKPAATATPSRVATPGNGGPLHSTSIVKPPKIVDDYVPVLDTTLTIRTLTKSEAEDANRPKWFVVQLALSEQPINLDTMPKLDIFAAYRLYSVALMEGGGIRHALRLGFFRENVSAEAVMGYLKAFFPTPAITQISVAEHDRFAEPRAKAKPNAEPEKVVNLNDKRAPAPGNTARPQSTTQNAVASKPREAKPRVSPAVARPQSFLSRLIGRQLD